MISGHRALFMRCIDRLAPVPGRPIGANPGLKFFFPFLYLPSYSLLRVTLCVIIAEGEEEPGPEFCHTFPGFRGKEKGPWEQG